MFSTPRALIAEAFHGYGSQIMIFGISKFPFSSARDLNPSVVLYPGSETKSFHISAVCNTYKYNEYMIWIHVSREMHTKKCRCEYYVLKSISPENHISPTLLGPFFKGFYVDTHHWFTAQISSKFAVGGGQRPPWGYFWEIWPHNWAILCLKRV